MALYWLLITEIIVECLVFMLEPASTMIEKKQAKKLKVYTTSSFWRFIVFL